MISPSGLRRLSTYDAIGQTVSLIHQTGAGVLRQRWTFTYDAAGNRESVRDGDATTTYTDDARNRLTQDVTTGVNAHTYVYSYDAIDNRLTSNEGASVMTTTYDAASQMTTSVDSSGTTTYTYDANGNLTEIWHPSGNRVTMGYDKENRLSVHTSGATVNTMTHSGGGLKRAEITASGRTTLIWAGSDYLQSRS